MRNHYSLQFKDTFASYEMPPETSPEELHLPEGIFVSSVELYPDVVTLKGERYDMIVDRLTNGEIIPLVVDKDIACLAIQKNETGCITGFNYKSELEGRELEEGEELIFPNKFAEGKIKLDRQPVDIVVLGIKLATLYGVDYIILNVTYDGKLYDISVNIRCAFGEEEYTTDYDYRVQAVVMPSIYIEDNSNYKRKNDQFVIALEYNPENKEEKEEDGGQTD